MNIKKMKDLRELFLKEIKRAFPDVIVNGSYRSRLPSNLNISILGVDQKYLYLN